MIGDPTQPSKGINEKSAIIFGRIVIGFVTESIQPEVLLMVSVTL